MEVIRKSVSEIVEIFDVTTLAIYSWIKRYNENGIEDPEMCLGQSCKLIMDSFD